MALAAPRLTISSRDLRIITAARGKLGGARVSFEDAVRALHEATAEEIAGGRIYALDGGVIGSLISGVGIVEDSRGIVIVRRGVLLGRFA